MASSIPGKDLRKLNFGTSVLGAPKVLPATTAQTVFTVANGKVMITSFVGVFTTVGSATSTTLKVNVVPTTGPAADLAAVSSAFTTQAVGSIVSISGVPADATLIGGSGIAPRTNGIVVPAGSVQVTTSATNTGAVQWLLTYIPLDDGATVVAA